LRIQLSEATSKKQRSECEQLVDWYSKKRDVFEENRTKDKYGNNSKLSPFI